MEKKLSVEDRQPMFAQLDGVMVEAAKLMGAQKINGEQMIIVDRALGIIRAALRLESI